MTFPFKAVRQRFAGLDGVTLHSKIQIADGRAAQHIAHGSSGQPDRDRRFGRNALNLGYRPVLGGIEVAFERKHVIAHSLIRRSFLFPTCQALG